MQQRLAAAAGRLSERARSPTADQLGNLSSTPWYRHAGAEGWVSCRSPLSRARAGCFGSPGKYLAGGFKFLVDVAGRSMPAALQATIPRRVVFCPPVGGLRHDRHRAGEDDVASEEALPQSAECDRRPARKHARGSESRSSGPGDLIRGSEAAAHGSTRETGEGQPKRHLHWRLASARTGQRRAWQSSSARRTSPPTSGSAAATRRNQPVVSPISAGRGAGTARTDPVLVPHRGAATPTSRSISIPRSPPLEAAAPQDKTNGAGSRLPHRQRVDWAPLIQKVLTAESFHEPLTVLAMKMLVAGMGDRAAANMLRGLMQNAAGELTTRSAGKIAVTTISPTRSRRRGRRSTAQAQWGQRSRSCRSTPWAKLTPPMPPAWALLPDVIETLCASSYGASAGCDPAGLAASALAVLRCRHPRPHKNHRVKQH